MSFLVTGAAGFIGSHLCRHLKNDIICCDTTANEMLSPEKAVSFLENKKNSIECVYHLGAISSTTETNIHKLTKANISFSSQLLECCIAFGIPFVYASSASVYGLGMNGFQESAPLTPLNYYAISKATLDMYAMQKIKDNPSAKIIGLRYFNVYGKGEDHKGDMASPVHKFFKQARLQKTIKIFEGSENFYRDFIHVNDVVSITSSAQEFVSGIYNVGTGTPRSFWDVADIVKKMTDAKIIKTPFPPHLTGKYQKYTRSENSKINKIFPHKFISLENGIKEVAT